MNLTAGRIDEYARSMFAFDRPHPRWIESCATYLSAIFGSRLKDSVFLDYAFGRGNWSLAALKAGARRVVAIDASETNVRNLDAYCRENGIQDIEIIHGNIMSEAINRKADILWIYGILPCIQDPRPFLTGLAAMRASDSAMALLYAYDAGSLRETVVMAARQACFYQSEKEFAEDSFLFTPRARLRARDDLTAPVIQWQTQDELAELGRTCGYVTRDTFDDYTHWVTKTKSAEFSPHHIICTFSGAPGRLKAEPPRPDRHDIAVIGEIAGAVLSGAPERLRKSIAIGLVSTHFSPPDGTIASILVQDFLFLMHAMMRLGLSPEGLSVGREVYDACMKAVAGKPRSISSDLLAQSAIARHLHENSVRL
jgi:predicted RNA methylase